MDDQRIELLERRLDALERDLAAAHAELAKWRDPMTRLDAWCDDLGCQILDRLEKIEAVQGLLVMAEDPDGPLAEQQMEIQSAVLGLPPVERRS